MPRKHILGVGRGNGAGSRTTQFRAEMPSRNPKGRPRKPKAKPSATIAEAMQKALSELVPVQLGNGRSARMPLRDAMIKKMLREFGGASIKDKMALIKMISALGLVVEEKSYEPSVSTVNVILAEIDAALNEEEEKERLVQSYN